MRYFVIDKKVDAETKKHLYNFGKIIFTEEIENLYEPVNTHPDIQIHFFNRKFAVCCPELYRYYKSVLPKHIKLLCGKNSVGGGYPNDAAYNAAVVGKNLICNVKYTDRVLLDYYTNLNYNIINVNQGYTKCNICQVADNAVITEDAGIAAELYKNGIEVCFIKTGGINLKNFDYGFIGGASGFLNDETIGFFGNLKLHSEFDKMNDFIKKFGKKIISIGNNSLTDYGSIISF